MTPLRPVAEPSRDFAQLAQQLARMRKLAPPLVVVTSECSLLDITPQAQAYLEAADGVSKDGTGRLISTNPAVTMELRDCLHRLSIDPRPVQRVLRLPRRSGAPDLVAIIRRQPVNPEWLEPESAGFEILLIDPGPNEDAGLRVVAQAYALTPAEVRLTEALLTTGSLEAAADHLAITRNTAKSQLTAIFRKTSTRRQAELIRLLVKFGVFSAGWEVEQILGSGRAVIT